MSSMQQNVSPSGRREVMGGLAKGLEVLRTFSRAKPHMTLSEIAARAGLPAATARRCLNTLEELGYVARNGRQFLLRPQVLEIGAHYLDSMGIQTLTQTKLEELALATRGGSSLAVLSGTGVVIVARGSARTEALPLDPHVGQRLPAHATSLGKVLLAGLGPERLAAWFDKAELTRYTDRTITDRATLMQHLETVRRDGYATAEEEVTGGVVGLAVPVRDAAGRVVAALSVGVHISEATAQDLVQQHLAALRDASLSVSAEAARMPVIALSAQVS
jgi:IclR family pca regulon transcriptional regulator